MRLLGILCAGLLATTSTASYSAIYDVSGTFVVRSPTGQLVEAIDNTVFGIYDDAGSTSLRLNTKDPFQGLLWLANGTVYGPGDWTFEACLADGSTNCTSPSTVSMSVGAGQWGGHLLVDWGSVQNIDVLNVWDITTSSSGAIILTSTDPDGDGILGIPMVDGPLKTFSWSYELVLTPQTVPIPENDNDILAFIPVIIGAAKKAPQQEVDFTGTWLIHEEASSFDPYCAGSLDYDVFVTKRDDGTFSVDWEIKTVLGSLVGESLEVSYTGTTPEDGGTTTSDFSGTFSFDDSTGYTMTGYESWSWTDGNDSCSGTSTFAGTKNTQ